MQPNAVLSTLQLGKHGRYPHLEQTTREKLNQLLPNEEKKKVNAIRIKMDEREDATNEKASLHDWLLSAPKTASTSKKQPDITPPVRAVTNTNLGSAVCVPSTKSSTNLSSNHQPPTTTEKNNSSTVFRKEKLTTKVSIVYY